MELLRVMEGGMLKYPAQQKPPVPVRMRGVFPDVVLVSPLPEEPSQAGEKAEPTSSQLSPWGMFGQSADIVPD